MDKNGNGNRSEQAAPGPGAGAGMFRCVLAIAGAIAGGALGYAGCLWMARHGFYSLILPGVLVGLGCGLLSGRRSIPLGAACAVLGLAAGLLARWRLPLHPKSFGDFMANLHSLDRVGWMLILLGTAFAFWFGMGRGRR